MTVTPPPSTVSLWGAVAEGAASWRHVWWRLSAVLFLQVLTALIIGLLVVWAIAGLQGLTVLQLVQNLYWGNMESVLGWQLQPDGRLTGMTGAQGLLFFGGVLLTLLAQMLAYIATLLVLRAHYQARQLSPLTAYCRQSWSYVWRFLGILIRQIGAVLLPIIMLGVVFVVLGTLLFKHLENETPLSDSLMQGLQQGELPLAALPALLAMVLVLLVLGWAVVRVLFAGPYLVESDSPSSREAFLQSKQYMRSHVWRVLGVLLILGFGMGLLSQVVTRVVMLAEGLPVIAGSPSPLAQAVWALADILVVSPLLLSILYALMRRTHHRS
ncbi:hypothetical protein H6771_01290 [Candidatus Peribacteria bacterium]|nr:hypothetical protein [Candidatus Peribacteria bacterium]